VGEIGVLLRVRCRGAGVKLAKAAPNGLIVVSDASTADFLLLGWLDESGDIESRSRSGVDNVYEEGTASRIGSNEILVVQFTAISCGD